jgi:hypothetical protein
MPKKSLLIALGSTGQRIVDGVLRRVQGGLPLLGLR